MSEGQPHAQPALLPKLRILIPYFAGTQWAFVLGGLGAALAAVCEAGVAWLMIPLVDGGFDKAPIKVLAHLPHPPLWTVPVILIGLFAVRGLAGFVVDYMLAWAANQAQLRLRSQLFARLLDAHPQLYNHRSASSLMNTVVYEVLNGVNQLVGAAQIVLKDTFTVVAMLGALLLINWQLALVIAALGPAVGATMKVFGPPHAPHHEGIAARGRPARLCRRGERARLAHGATARRAGRAARALRAVEQRAAPAADEVDRRERDRHADHPADHRIRACHGDRRRALAKQPGRHDDGRVHRVHQRGDRRGHAPCVA
jgi:subfamily B ATP-binding cassette protein MsbA